MGDFSIVTHNTVRVWHIKLENNVLDCNKMFYLASLLPWGGAGMGLVEWKSCQMQYTWQPCCQPKILHVAWLSDDSRTYCGINLFTEIEGYHFSCPYLRKTSTSSLKLWWKKLLTVKFDTGNICISIRRNPFYTMNGTIKLRKLISLTLRCLILYFR